MFVHLVCTVYCTKIHETFCETLNSHTRDKAENGYKHQQKKLPCCWNKKRSGFKHPQTNVTSSRLVVQGKKHVSNVTTIVCIIDQRVLAERSENPTGISHNLKLTSDAHFPGLLLRY